MGKVISVVSGKGGTGKSTFSAGIATALSRLSRRVLLVDLDLGLRSLDILLGLEDKVVFDIGDVLQNRCSFADALSHSPANPDLLLLCSPIYIDKSFNLPAVISLIASHADDYDYVILDIPAGIGLSILASKQLAQLAVVITVPDAVTIRDTRTVCDALAAECGCEFKLVVNRVTKGSMRLCKLADLDRLMDLVGAPLLGVLGEDSNISLSLQSKKGEKSLNISTKKAFAAIAERIDGRDAPLVIRSL